MKWVNLYDRESSPIKKAIAAFGGLLLFAMVSNTAAAAGLRAGFASPSLNVAILWITQEGRLFEKMASTSKRFTWKARWRRRR